MAQVISVGPRVNEADLGNGFYPQLSTPIAYDDEYRNKLAWLAQQCTRLPNEIRLIAQANDGDITPEQDGVPTLPTVIAFGFGADEERLDAALVGIMPHVARVELINRYGGGDPSAFVMYEPPAAPHADGSPSPVGERWPAMDAKVGGKAYRPANDNPMAKPYKEGDVVQGFRLAFVWVTFANCAVWVKVN